MKITLTHYKDIQSKKSETFDVSDFKIISTATNLLFIISGKFDDEALPDINEHIEIYKVQFIGTGNISIADNLLFVFYLNEQNELSNYIIGNLPDEYIQITDDNYRTIVDYTSYCNICDLTQETKLSLLEYIKERRSGNIGPNTILHFDDKVYNYDQQKLFWESADNGVGK